ncbi:helix-turn-helix domain-containing protein [Blastococcus sp. SYSU D00922]
MDSPFDLCGALRRIRRVADLSQRELADAAGIPPSTLAHAESGTRDLGVGSLARAAAVAGLRLTVVDSSGAEVGPMSAGAVRDLGGRRFPAHLDTARSDEALRLDGPRRDRPETSFTYGRDRGARDACRRVAGTPPDHHARVPGDSPAGRREERRRAAAQARDDERRRRFVAGESRRLPEPFVCTCPPGCDEMDDWSGRPVHTEDCPCSCDLG